MKRSGHGQDTSELLGELEAKVADLAMRNRASTNVVRTIGTFVRDGGKIPAELAMAIGGCLIEYVDCEGRCSDPDIQLLYEQIDKSMDW
jgi:seryl-tRNA(Sec) selenium transferase